MKRDSLLLLSTSYPEAGDGSEAAGAFVADLAKRLAVSVPVRVVAPGIQPGQTESTGALTVRRFASAGRPLSLLSPTNPQDWLDIFRTLRSLRAQTLASNSDGRVAHVVALWVLPSGWAAAALARKHGIGYSVWALGSDIWSLGKFPMVRTLLRRVIRGARHRFADGLKLAQDAGALSGTSFEFLPSTRDVPLRASTRGGAHAQRLLFLGRWHPNKGIDLLLEALGMLDETTWQRLSEVHVAGGGPLEPDVRQRVAELQAKGRPVRLSGFLAADAAHAAIARADWLLIPSRVESIPVVFSDAMKLGCPVVSMPVGDLRQLVSNEPACGIVASEVTARSFAVAIARALAGSPTRFQAGVVRAAARFDLDAVASRILEAAFGSHLNEPEK